MIEWIPTVISISISAVMRLFGRGGKTGASNRETEVNQRSGDASTQVVSGDHAIMNFGTANVDAVPSNPVLTPALRWHDCPHLRPERVSLDEVKAVSAFVSLRLLYGGSPSSGSPSSGSPFHQECTNPGLSGRWHCASTRPEQSRNDGGVKAAPPTQPLERKRHEQIRQLLRPQPPRCQVQATGQRAAAAASRPVRRLGQPPAGERRRHHDRADHIPPGVVRPRGRLPEPLTPNAPRRVIRAARRRPCPPRAPPALSRRRRAA